MFKTAAEAINWVMEQRSVRCGLDQFKEVMKDLGNPQDSFKSIHVAGTNGKGSTVQFIQEILMEAGYKVGAFTSPHLVSHQDRIRVQGQWIPDESFLRIINRHYECITKHNMNMFEIDTLIMSEYFKEEQVDFGLIEVGIGGRRDSTNCLSHPCASVIVSVGYDHCDLLGTTLESITKEKAGIIKKEGLCVVGEMPSEVIQVLMEEAERKKARLIFAKELEESVELSSFAQYQRKNAAVALEVINQLEEKGVIKVTEEQKEKGLWKSNWPGRYELMEESPRIILDGAHNAEGILALTQSIQNEQAPIVIIFSVLMDKAVDEMMNELVKVADYIFVVEFDFYRALKVKDYPKMEKVHQSASFEEALQQARQIVKKEGTILCCGSLYFISEIRKKWKSK